MRTHLSAWYALLRRIVRERRQPLVWMSIGVVIGLLAAAVVGQFTSQPLDTAARKPPASASPGPGAGLPSGPPTTEPSAPPLNQHVQPSRLSIPSIGVQTSFVNLGLNADGTLEVPRSYDVAGWYAAGPAPGDSGGPPAVIAGHVDSAAGPGVFFRLRDLQIGGDIAIGGNDGAVRHFRVYRLDTYEKRKFPAAAVYAPTGKAEIRLITCTGVFNRQRHSYESNLVAYATLVEDV